MAQLFHEPSNYLYEEGALFLGTDNANREIGIKTERHAITVAGSRAGKGAALLIPNARRWPENLLVVDPKGENAALCWEAREARGQSVYVLDPFNETEKAGVPDRLRAGFNPLAAIDLESNRARPSIMAIANGLIVSHDPRHMEWIEGARKIVAGVIAYVVADAPTEQRTFAAVRNILMQPAEIPTEEGEEPQGLYADAQIMAADTRAGGLIRAAGVAIMSALTGSKMESEFLSNAQRSTDWLDDPAIAQSLAESTFDLGELKHGEASVFLVLPADSDILETYAAFLRLFVKAALDVMGRSQGDGRRCLFLLDEFYSLGKLDELASAAGRLPSYGVHLWPFLQDLGQLHALYGQHVAETFFANADVHAFFGISDPLGLENVSRRCGEVTPDEMPEPPNIEPFSYPAFEQKSWIFGPPEHGSSRRSFWEMDQGNAERAYTAEKEAARARHDTHVANLNALYQKQKDRLGRRRLNPEDVAQLVGKAEGDKLARSMIVFAPAGQRFNLRLEPYFKPKLPPPMRALPAPAPEPTPPIPPPSKPVPTEQPRKISGKQDAILFAFIAAAFGGVGGAIIGWAMITMGFSWEAVLVVGLLATIGWLVFSWKEWKNGLR